MTTLPAGLTGTPDISVEYEVYQEDVMVASSNSLLDAEHYAEQYRQDGPVELVTCVRIPGLLAAAPTPPATTQDEPITVALDPDPRGVSVGVWQGSSCIYTGVHAVPASVAPGDAQDDDSDIPELRSEAEIGFEDWLTRQMPKGTVISNPAWWAPRILRAAERLIRAEEQLAAAPAAGDALDAARYRWLRDHACNSLHLTRDGDHACNYLTAAQWIESCPEDFQDDAPEEIERMKATNTIWRLQVYPSTPIGFWVLHASTLDAAIDAALAAQVPQQGEA